MHARYKPRNTRAKSQWYVIHCPLSRIRQSKSWMHRKELEWPPTSEAAHTAITRGGLTFSLNFGQSHMSSRFDNGEKKVTSKWYNES